MKSGFRVGPFAITFLLAITIALLLLIASCAPLPEKQPPAAPPPAEFDGSEPDEDDPVPEPGTFPEDPLFVDDGESPPIELVPTHSDPAKQFRAASWNIRNWYRGKNNRSAGAHPNAGSMIETLFAAFEQFDLDVIALQELYVTSDEPALPIPPAHAAKYSVIYGTVAINSGQVRSEYCPIVFDTTEITCKPDSSAVWQFNNRGIHWAVCHPKDHADKEFFFGCGHFDPDSTRAKVNITNFFARLKESPDGPTFKFGANGIVIDRSEFIVGMDANSEYHSTNGLGRWWRIEHAAFEPNAGQPLIQFDRAKGPFAGVGPFGVRTFTKLHGRYYGSLLDLRLNRDKRLWILDDLFWSLSGIRYVSGSKQVVPVQRLAGIQNMTPAQRAAFWQAYYEFSDHLPIKADFQFAE